MATVIAAGIATAIAPKLLDVVVGEGNPLTNILSQKQW